MTWLLVTVMLATGVLAGLVGGLLGIGGCSIILPVLIFIFEYPEPIAIGTTITAVVITAVSGAVGHIRIRNVDFRTAAIINATGGGGAALGSVIFYMIRERIWLLDIILGAAFIYVAVRMLYEGIRRLSPSAADGKFVPGGLVEKAVLGFGIGVVTGIIGLGGGYALMPAFIYLLHAPVKIAVGTSLAAFIGQAVVSAGFKLHQGVVDLIAAIALGVGTALGAQVGARLVPKVPGWLIKALFGALFTVVSVKFLLKGIHVLLAS